MVLALAPFAWPALPVDLAPARAASGSWLIAQDGDLAQAREPAPRVRPAQPLALGVLARWSGFEVKLGPTPHKPPLFPLNAADRPQPAPRASAALLGDHRAVFHRSSVGTARRPTGPPSREPASD
jgi:hypothetical protein